MNPDWTPEWTERDRLVQLHSTDQPEAHSISAEFRALADSYGDCLLVGEIFLPNERHARWYGTIDKPQVHLPFNFQLIEGEWDASSLRTLIANYLASLPPHGWPNWVLGSHDAPRIAGRIGEAQARVAMMLLLTLRGTPTLYQGDELAIGNVPISVDRIRDPQHFRQPHLDIGRDRSRTPMPWAASAHAGFSSADPWLPLNPDWKTRNVSAQDADPDSMLSLTRGLLDLRKTTAALTIGDMHLLDAPDGMIAFERTHSGVTRMILLNLTAKAISLPWRETPVLSTLPGPPTRGTVRPDEGLIVK